MSKINFCENCIDYDYAKEMCKQSGEYSGESTVFCAGRRFYISNADHLRELPDEELAEEIMNWFAALYTVEWSTETVLEYLREPYEVKHD